MCNQTAVGSDWEGGHIDECLRVKTGIKHFDTIESDLVRSENESSRIKFADAFDGECWNRELDA